MNTRQANRAVIASRAAQSASPSRPTLHGTVGTNPALRTITTTAPLRSQRGGLTKSRAGKLTATQRNSHGRRSEWNRSPYAPFGGWR